MSGARRQPSDYLGHILQAIERIERYTAGMDESTFLTDVLVQDGVIRNLEIVGEASRNISRHFPDFAAAHSLVPLSAAYEMRNVLAHGYADVDVSIVWVVVQRDLPALKRQVLKFLHKTCRRAQGGRCLVRRLWPLCDHRADILRNPPLRRFAHWLEARATI